MFRNIFQSGFISLLSASGSHPLQLWDVRLEDDGEIRWIKDDDDTFARRNESNHVIGPVIEIVCSNLSQNYIICPTKLDDSSRERPSLGITLSFLYFTLCPEITKQQQRQQQTNHFSLEVTILDDKKITRRFRCSTYQSTTSIKTDLCTFPLRLTRRPQGLKRDELLLPSSERDSYEQGECESCWNRVCFPLAEYTQKVYGTILLETKHVQIHATNFQIKQVFFAEKQLSEDELPLEFRLFQ